MDEFFDDEFRNMFLDIIENFFDFEIEGSGVRAAEIIDQMHDLGYEKEFAFMITSMIRFCTISIDAIYGTENRMAVLLGLMMEDFNA